MKLLRGILLGLVILAAALFLGKDMIAKTALTGGIKMVTGLNAQASGMQVGVPIIGIQGLKIMNPSGYPDPVMVSLKEFMVNYDLQSILGGKAHLRKLVLNLEEVAIIKRQDGAVNIQQIKALQQKPASSKSGKPAPAGKAPPLKIDALDLRIGRVVFKDYTHTPAAEKIFNLNISEQHENIGDTYALAGLIVLKIMSKTGLAAITNIDVGDLQAGVNDALQFSQQAANKALGDAQAMGKNALKNTQDMINNPAQLTGNVADTGKQAVGAAKDAADSLKKLFKNQP